MSKIFVFHGPNLNLLGRRQPEHYGHQTLEEINTWLQKIAVDSGVTIECRQTNHEGILLEWIHALGPDDFLILNPGAWTHYNYAVRDAIAGARVPAIEVHLSNIHAREEFRSRSVVAPVCLGQIAGLGAEGYLLALRYAVTFLKQREAERHE